MKEVTKTRYITDLGHFLRDVFEGVSFFCRSGEVSEVDVDFIDVEPDSAFSSSIAILSLGKTWETRNGKLLKNQTKK